MNQCASTMGHELGRQKEKIRSFHNTVQKMVFFFFYQRPMEGYDLKVDSNQQGF